MKDTTVINPETAKATYPGIIVTGNPDLFTVLSKASFAGSEGKPSWMKSTKAMEIFGVGALVQVSTQINNFDGTLV